MKFKLTATIPVGNYANIMPELEVEAPTYETAKDEAFARLDEVWAQYGVVPLNKNSTPQTATISPTRKKIQAFVGGEIYFDPTTHIYDNENGQIYLSGSSYANQFRKPFNKTAIAGAMAKKAGCDPQTIIDMWELKGEVSRDFGNAIHKSLQLYETHRELASLLEKTSNLHDHPIIKKAVMSFVDAHKDEIVQSEALVVDHKAKHAGRIDRLLITGDKQCRVQDFKTNATIEKELEVYWKQLEFYQHILEAGGWIVEGLDIFHFDGTWKTYSKEITEGKI